MKRILFIAIILIFSFSVSAQPYPHIFFGNVSYPENPDFPLKDIQITARLNEDDLGVIGRVKENNYYDVAIPIGSGKLIFYIGGVEAEPSFNKEYKMFERTESDLAIHRAPNNTCGNNVIDRGEQCDRNNFGFFGDGINQCIRYDSKYESGNLLCNNDCQIETTQCIERPIQNPPGNNNNGGGSSGGGGSGGGSNGNSQNTPQNPVVFLGDENTESPSDENETIALNEDPGTSGIYNTKLVSILKKAGPFVVIGFLIALAVASIAVRRVRKKKLGKR